MRKLILFFLLSIATYGQTSNGSETKQNAFRSLNPQTVVNPLFLGTMGSDGTMGKTDASLWAKKTDLPNQYAKIVYVNSTNPNSATIFSEEIPPIVNNDLLKQNADYLYIGNDATTWIYNGTNYATKTASRDISNFWIKGTSLDAGASKSGKIYRTGSVESSKFITSDKTDDDIVLGTGNTISKTDLIDYLEFNTASALPVTGVAGKIYLTKDDNKLYRWNGTVYSLVSDGGGGSSSTPTLQQVIDTNSLADADNGINYINLFGGSAYNKIFEFATNENDYSSGSYAFISKNVFELQNYSGASKYAKIDLTNAELAITLRGTGAFTTQLKMSDNPIVNTIIRVPTLNIAGTYTLATEEWVLANSSGGSSATNLSTTANATTVTVVSDTGTDAVIPAVSNTDAGIVTVAQKANWDSKQDALGFTPYNSTNPSQFQTLSQVNDIASQKVSNNVLDGNNNETIIAPSQRSVREAIFGKLNVDGSNGGFAANRNVITNSTGNLIAGPALTTLRVLTVNGSGIPQSSGNILTTELNFLAGATTNIPTAIGVINSSLSFKGTYTTSATAQTTFTVNVGRTMGSTTYNVIPVARNMLSAVTFFVTNKTTTTFDIVVADGLTGSVSYDFVVTP